MLSRALGCAGLSILVVVIAHLAWFSLVTVERRSRALISLWIGGVALHVASCLWLGVDAWRTGYGVVVIFCAFILYMPVYYTVATSLSARMLIDVDRAGGRLASAELWRRHAPEQILAGRLQTLESAGYVSRAGDRFAITPKGRLVVHPFVRVKQAWRLGPGG